MMVLSQENPHSQPTEIYHEYDIVSGLIPVHQRSATKRCLAYCSFSHKNLLIALLIFWVSPKDQYLCLGLFLPWCFSLYCSTLNEYLPR